MLRKIAEIKVPTGAGAREAKTEPVFASYDRQGAAFAFYFSDSIVAGTKANLLFMIDGQKVFVDDDVTLGETNETHTFTYPLPDELLNYTGKIDGYLYFDFEDGSHSDEIHFVFTIKKSQIDETMEDAPDVYIKSFEDVKAEVQEAADGAKETISQKVTEVSDTSDSAISKVNQVADDTIKTADQAKSDMQDNVDQVNKDYEVWKAEQEEQQTTFESDTNKTINGINTKVEETQTKVSDLEKNADDLATKQYVDESVEGFNETITTQLAQKADEDEVRFRNTAIGINDLDGETLGIIQDGSGGNPIEVLSIPRDKSVTEKKTTFLIHDETSNLIDRSTYLYDSYIRGDAIGQGKVYSASDLTATDYIALKPDTDYYFSQIYTGYYAYYDENYDYITGRGFNTADGGPLPTLKNPFRIPSNAKYGRFTIGNSEDPTKAWIHTENATPSLDKRYQFKDNILISSNNVVNSIEVNGEPTEYAGDDIGIFNNILAVGDSLTAGTFNIRGTDTSYTEYKQYAFPKYLQKMTGVSVKNEGRSGATAKEWYDAMSDTPLTGYDCAIIQLGVNDLFRKSTLEETKTYITNIINKLKTENTGIKIFVSTIIPATSYSKTGYIAISDAIREVVASITSDVYLVDLAAYGHTKDKEAYNNGHLSAYGYWKLAKDYKAYISYIIASNKLAFRNIQFAGTDDTY